MQPFFKYRTYISIFLSMLLIAIVLLVRPEDEFSESRHAAEHDRFWLIKAKNTGHYNLIALGDSRTYRGISPATMEAELPGIKAFNFGFSAGGLNKEVFNLAEKRLIQENGVKIILLGVTVWSLTHKASLNTHLRQEINRPWSAVVEKVYLYPLAEPFYSFDIFDKLKNKHKPEIRYTNKRHDNGWVESQKVPEDTTEALDEYKRQLEEHKTEPELVADLLEQTRLWTAQNIRVYAFRPPTTRAMLELEVEKSEFNYPDFEREFEKAGGKWINADLDLYHSYDGSHLVDTSAVQLSKYLANEIKKDL